jgi:hypothetical protein
MKKILSIFLVFFAVITADAQTYKWPAANSTAIVLANNGVTTFTAINNCSHVAAITTLTANATFSVVASSQLKAGAKIVLAIKTTSTETTTFAGAIVAPVVTGVAGKTWAQTFIYNGTNFYPCGAKIQVD